MLALGFRFQIITRPLMLSALSIPKLKYKRLDNKIACPIATTLVHVHCMVSLMQKPRKKGCSRTTQVIHACAKAAQR